MQISISRSEAQDQRLFTAVTTNLERLSLW